MRLLALPAFEDNYIWALVDDEGDALVMARELAQNASVPVRLVDERLTTVSAHSALRAAGKKQKQTRSVIDQVAAVMILQHALDSERSSGNLPGKDISEFPAQS